MFMCYFNNIKIIIFYHLIELNTSADTRMTEQLLDVFYIFPVSIQYIVFLLMKTHQFIRGTRAHKFYNNPIKCIPLFDTNRIVYVTSSVKL